MGSHHDDGDFAKLGELPVDEELQVYTWPDASLREISGTIPAPSVFSILLIV